MNLFWCKANVKRFGFNNLGQDFDIIKIVHTATDACRNNKSKENVYNERFINVHLAFLICLACEMMFENVGFLRDQKSPPVFKEIRRKICIYRCRNNSRDIKDLVKIIKTESFNVCFTSK